MVLLSAPSALSVNAPGPRATPSVDFGDSIFVSSQFGSDSQTGLTRAFPVRTLGRAFALIATNRRNIIVMPGTYRGPLVIGSGTSGLDVHLLGEKGADSTTIVGDSTESILTFDATDTDSSIVEGFTFTGNIMFDSKTCYDCAPGITIRGGNKQLIQDNRFVELDNQTYYGYGGAISILSFGQHCIFNNVFEKCKVSDEYYGQGGAIYNQYSDAVILGNLFLENSCMSYGGAIWNGYSTVPIIVNNTFIHNSADYDGSAIFHQAEGRLPAGTQQILMEVNNNIFYQNYVSPAIGAYGPVPDFPRNNLFFGNAFGDSLNNITLGPGNIFADPQFVDPLNGDFRLDCGSPAFDAGRLPLPFAGDFTTDIDGEQRIAYNTVDIGCDEYIDMPMADFIQDATLGCGAMTVRFTNLTECSDIPRTYLWNFGDGTTSTSANPIKSYANPGRFTVTLTVSVEPYEDGSNSVIVKEDLIRIQPEPSTDFSFTPPDDCVPFPVAFQRTGSPDDDGELFWRFGDGATSQDEAPVHTYTVGGTYHPTLIVTNLCGTDSSVSEIPLEAHKKPSITIYTSVDADSLSGTDPLCFPLEVRFHPVSDDDLLSHEWDFGDNSFSTEASPTHIYDDTAVRTYSAQLKATGICDTASAKRLSFVTAYPRPTASVDVDSTEGCAPWTLMFRADTSGTLLPQNFKSFVWHFGDGDTAIGASATHTYMTPGNYTPVLSWVDFCGSGSADGPMMAASTSPVVAFAPTQPVSGPVPFGVQFTDQSGGNPTGWQWDFGDGEVSSVKSPHHAYQNPGVYDVSLIPTNRCGTASELTKPGLVIATGFSFDLDSIGKSGDSVIYSADIDTVVGAYPDDVFLSFEVVDTPRRGTLSAKFEPASGQPPFTSRAAFAPSLDLATGLYQIDVTAADPTRREEVESIAIQHTGVTIVERSASFLDFDSVVVGATGSRPVWLRNTAPLGSGLTLRIDSAWTDHSQYSVALFTMAPINPGDSGIVITEFSPTAIAIFNSRLRVATNNPSFPLSGVDLTGRGIPEQLAPCICQVSPADSSTDVLIDQDLVFQFCEPMLQPTIPWDDIVLVTDKNDQPLDVDVALNNDELVISPVGNWPPDDSISVILVSRLTDVAGNRFDGDCDGFEEGPPLDNVHYFITTSPGVRPGDANNDLVVDARDVLPLGRFWELIGPGERQRLPEWTIEPAAPWTPREATYADCNGDNVVDSMDVCPIAEFFDLSAAPARVVHGEVLVELAGLDGEVLSSLIRALEFCEESNGTGRTQLREILEELAKSPEALPGSYYLAPNYPNPFNAATVVEYGLPRASEVRIEMFNVRGERVGVLAEGMREAGHHRLVIDTERISNRPLPSGVYFLRLQTNDYQKTRKLMLLK